MKTAEELTQDIARARSWEWRDIVAAALAEARAEEARRWMTVAMAIGLQAPTVTHLVNRLRDAVEEEYPVEPTPPEPEGRSRDGEAPPLEWRISIAAHKAEVDKRDAEIARLKQEVQEWRDRCGRHEQARENIHANHQSEIKRLREDHAEAIQMRDALLDRARVFMDEIAAWVGAGERYVAWTAALDALKPAPERRA